MQGRNFFVIQPDLYVPFEVTGEQSQLNLLPPSQDDPILPLDYFSFLHVY
jgi:hypothetical protein